MGYGYRYHEVHGFPVPGPTHGNLYYADSTLTCCKCGAHILHDTLFRRVRTQEGRDEPACRNCVQFSIRNEPNGDVVPRTIERLYVSDDPPAHKMTPSDYEISAEYTWQKQLNTESH